MNENTKTLTFVLVAVVILLGAWLFRPRVVEDRPEELVGQLLVQDFDPLTAASLEILKYDEKQARVESFQVSQDKKGIWSIPSHDNYPADAKEHLAEAATSLLGTKILEVASHEPGDHEQFGVLDPDPQNPRKGMGTRVVMKDKEGKELLALVIGKEVPDFPELRYVRRVGQDHVFVASLKTDKLSTRFEDWIEKDLLKLNPWDIKEVEIRDYSVDIVRGMIIQRGEMTLEYNDTGDPRWKLVRDRQVTDQGLRDIGLGPEEELNTTKLDDMKFALDDLKIVDVNPKPQGLSADLKAEQTLITNKEAVANLAARGFYPAQVEDRYEIVSNEGEIRVLMKDGVEYLLRFGGPAGTGEASEQSKQADKPDQPAEKKSEDQEKKSPGMNRFIMVTARFNESAIPKPELQTLPGESDEKTSEAKPESKPEASSSDAKPETSEKSAPSEKAQPAKESSKEEKPDAKKDPEQVKKELEQKRQEIEKENQRKLKEYQDKLEQGRKRAKELNDRFAEWYYIISEDTYKKIRLSRTDIVKKKEKEEKPKEEAAHDHEHKPTPPSASAESEKPQKSPESEKQPNQPSPKESPESKPAGPAAPKPPSPQPGPAQPSSPPGDAPKPDSAEPAPKPASPKP